MLQYSGEANFHVLTRSFDLGWANYLPFSQQATQQVCMLSIDQLVEAWIRCDIRHRTIDRPIRIKWNLLRKRCLDTFYLKRCFPILQLLAMIVHRHIGNDWHAGESKLGKAVTGENQSTSLVPIMCALLVLCVWILYNSVPSALQQAQCHNTVS